MLELKYSTVDKVILAVIMTVRVRSNGQHYEQLLN